jgi:hypothetical protein
LSTLIEAQQAYDIQLNQNDTDIKAAEQKARFARMDLEKHIGDKNTQDIIDKLHLYEKPFTNGLDLFDIDNDLFQNTRLAPTNGVNPGSTTNAPSRSELTALAGISPAGERPGQDNPNSGAAVVAPKGRPSERADTGAASKPGDAPAANPGLGAPVTLLSVDGLVQGQAARNGEAAAFQQLEMSAATNLLAKLNSAGKGTSTSSNPTVIIDFSLYATNVEQLGDGTAKQQLRKLEDDLFLAERIWGNPA